MRGCIVACAIFAAFTGGALAQPIYLSDGREANGQLTTSDERRDGGPLKDTYLWTGRAGQRLVLTLKSRSFDAFLRIEGPGGFVSENDDAFDDNTDAGLDIVLPAAGLYRITASALEAEETGPYVIKAGTSGQLESSGPPAIVLPPGVNLPPEIARAIAQNQRATQRPATAIVVGVATTGRIDPTDIADDEGRPSDEYVVRLRAGQHVLVIADSDVFDTFLSLRGPGLRLENDNQHGFNFGAPRTYAVTDIHDSAFFAVVPADGDYRLSVARQQENERGGAYRLRVFELPRLSLGRDLRGSLAAGDFTGTSGEFRDSFGFLGTAGQRIAIEMTSEDFEPRVTIWGRGEQPLAQGPSIDLRLPQADEYRIDIASMWPKRVGDYLVRSSGAALQALAPAPTVAQRLPNDCAAGRARLEQQRDRARTVGGDQLADINVELARAFLCLNDFVAADRVFDELVRTNGAGSPAWFDGVLSRIALAEMRGATTETAALRRQLSQGAGLAGLRYGGRLQQYGRSDYVIDPVDNLELLDFARMAELARPTPEAGVTVLAARYRTVMDAGRTALGGRMAVLLARFASQEGRDFGCESLTHLGVAYALAGQSSPAVDTLRRALAKGKENTVVRDEFRCGNVQDGSGDIIEQSDVVSALADAQVIGGDAAGALATLREYLGQRRDHTIGMQIALATEATGDSASALQQWRTAMAWGGDISAKFQGGSIHLVAADAFLRLGAPKDARLAFESFIRLVERRGEAPPDEINDLVRRARASVMLSGWLENGALGDALGCPTGRGSVPLSGGVEAVTFDDRAYYEYCRAWSQRAMATDPRRGQQTASLLLVHAQRAGWDRGEIQKLVESSMEANWSLAAEN